jgi:IS30 family transposase
MPGAPLSLPEREEIGLALIEDRSLPWAVIAQGIGRHPTTVMREVTANGGRSRYRPALSERRAEKGRRRSREPRLAKAGPLSDRVTAELKLGRSPVAIWADLVAEGRASSCASRPSTPLSTAASSICRRPTACGRDDLAGAAARPARSPSALACPTSLLAPLS